MIIRACTIEDAPALLQIYAPYVRSTAISFEYDVPSLEEFQKRITRTLERFPYLVAEDEGKILGYVYVSDFKTRKAYDHCVETSIYVDDSQRGRGVGRKLYEELEKRLLSMGKTNLCACIAWNDEEDEYLNHDSVKFHSSMGYVKCAHFHRCGYKFSRFYDMIWMEKIISPAEQN